MSGRKAVTMLGDVEIDAPATVIVPGGQAGALVESGTSMELIGEAVYERGVVMGDAHRARAGDGVAGVEIDDCQRVAIARRYGVGRRAFPHPERVICPTDTPAPVRGAGLSTRTENRAVP